MWSGEAERVSRPVSCVSRRVRRTVTVCAVYRVWILCVVASTQSVFRSERAVNFCIFGFRKLDTRQSQWPQSTESEKPVAAPISYLIPSAETAFAFCWYKPGKPVLLLVHRIRLLLTFPRLHSVTSYKTLSTKAVSSTLFNVKLKAQRAVGAYRA